MELRQLRFFVRVAEERSVSAAARHLNISQPPVTRHIQQLESEVGHELFFRTARGMRLTPAGAAFLPQCRKLLMQAERALEQSRAAARGEIGGLELGYSGSAIHTFLPRVLRRFRRAMPGAEVSLRRLSRSEQLEALHGGGLDVGIAHHHSGPVAAPGGGLVVERVGEERLFYAAGIEAAARHRGPVALHQIRDERLILSPGSDRPSLVDDVVDMFTRVGLVPNIGTLTEDAPTALAMAAGGSGATIVPESLALVRWPGIGFIPLDVERGVPIACVHGTPPLSPAVSTFMAVARQTLMSPADTDDDPGVGG